LRGRPQAANAILSGEYFGETPDVKPPGRDD
jgi:hypothetical protein